MPKLTFSPQASCIAWLSFSWESGDLFSWVFCGSALALLCWAAIEGLFCFSPAGGHSPAQHTQDCEHLAWEGPSPSSESSEWIHKWVICQLAPSRWRQEVGWTRILWGKKQSICSSLRWHDVLILKYLVKLTNLFCFSIFVGGPC